MSDIKFIIESSFKTSVPGLRPKRVKNACLRCQARKGRCSGTQPCDVCKSKNVPCIYRHSRSAKPDKNRLNSPVSQPLPEKPRQLSSSESTNHRTRTIRQPYFRWLGPTAIAPPKYGTFRLISVNLKSNEPDNGQYIVVERQDTSFAKSPVHTTSEESSVPVPLPSKNLYKLFNERMSNYLPYLPEEIFQERLADAVIGECLLYAMASLAERITPSDDLENDEYSLREKYAETAKRLIIPHLSCPSVEIVFALLLIAYCEFGNDRDSGLWSWSGMAIRMSYDLGLQTPNVNDGDSSFARNVFWSVVCLDRLISCGTGRATTIPDSVIEHDPEPRWIETSDGKRSDPFPYLCKLLILLGKVSNYLNSHTDDIPDETEMETFAHFQEQVSDFYTTLPTDLLFDVQNFQDYAKLKYSQVFLMLHVWNQALVLAVHQPSLVYPKCQLDITGGLNPHAQVTGSGAISIADMITFADLIEPDSFLANPFLSQAVYMGACASRTLWHSLKTPFESQPGYILQKTYNTCRQTLNRMQKIWRGISWCNRTLDSLEAAEPDVDLSVDSKVYVTTRDLGVIRRATVDESTRRWLASEIKQKQVDDIYGMFISGIIDETSPGSTSSLNEHVSNGPVNNGMTLYEFSDPTTSNAYEENSFKSLIIKDMNLNEFFNDNEIVNF